MRRSIFHSLLLRIGLIMVILTLLAISSMMTSAWIGSALQGKATAVNIAGSLRTQSYRIATRLLSAREVDQQTHWKTMQELVRAFESKLYGRDVAGVLTSGADSKARLAYDKVTRKWEREFKPVLESYITGIIPAAELKTRLAPGAWRMISGSWGMLSDTIVTSLRQRYLARMPKFVELIDRFVNVLAEDAEAKVLYLRIYQWVALALTIGITAFAVLLVNRQVLNPLHQLLACASAAGRGDFSLTAPNTGRDELGRLGTVFNNMAASLSKHRHDLEERVRIKTEDLERSNRSLEVLYNTVNRLSLAPSPHVTYQGLLEEVTVLAGTGPAAICLMDDVAGKAQQIAATRDTEAFSKYCDAASSAKCLDKRQTHFLDQPRADGSTYAVIAIPIQDAQSHHGVLLVEALDNSGFAHWQQRVLEAVASHIGCAISMSGLHAEQSRLALLEERSAIAGELHDSLAQSLSYARIQVSRLDSVIGGHDAAKGNVKLGEARKINRELRVGLNSAHKELRELLTTFRLTMDGHDLNGSISETVEEFNRRGEVIITFSSDCPNGLLQPNEEIHILQIVREALSNIVQHSQAAEAQIILSRCDGGRIELKIADNGVGLDHRGQKTEHEHYGLVIMRERATRLGGALEIDIGDNGTRLTLSFTPAVQAMQPMQIEAGTTSRHDIMFEGATS